MYFEAMFKCPKCNHTLLSTNLTCQFCGADVSAVPRPPEPVNNQKKAYKMVTAGTMRGFYATSVAFIVFGIAEICLGLGLFGSVGDFMKNIYIVFGLLMALLGTGLVFRAAFVYAMAGIFCALQFVLGLVDIIAAVMTIENNTFKYCIIALAIVQIILAGLMFYFAEETAVTSMSA